MLGNQVIERHGTAREFLNCPVPSRRNAGVAVNHLAHHRARNAQMSGERGGAPLFGVEPLLELFHDRSLTHLNGGGQAFPQCFALNIGFVKEYRRARFVELLRERFKGDRAKLAKDADITNGRITQLLDPEEPFGDTAARRLIDKLSLAQGYFDPPLAGSAPSHAGIAVANTYDRMSAQQREIFLKLLEVSFGARQEQRPPELGNSDYMDIELEMPDAEERKRRGDR